MSDIGEGEGPRIKFACERVGALSSEARSAAPSLREALAELEAHGCSPVLPDGMLAGNGARRLGSGALLVSASGRRVGETAQVVEVVDFDVERWAARFRSDDAASEPTSDTPLYWAALVEAATRFGWAAAPQAALHGHVLETERAAAALAVPLSAEATLFSTPPDREALLTLLGGHPYPTATHWIRRGHGFFTLAGSLPTARALVAELAGRARELGVLPS